MSGLYYETQRAEMVFGTKNPSTLALTPVTLTANYADNLKSIKCGGFTKVNFDIQYTMDASETANSIQLRVEGSPDGTNFYRIPNEQVSSGTSDLYAREFSFAGTNGTVATISIGLDIFYKFIRVAVKETGVATTYGTVSVDATLSGK